MPLPPPSAPRSTAKVVVFQDATSRSAAAGSKNDWRAFMSSDIRKVSGEKPVQHLTKKEAEQEAEDKKHDRDLADLIKTSKLIEDHMASELTGNERRKHMAARVAELGGRTAKTRTPRAIQMGMDVKERERAARRLQDAKDLGVYHSSLKTQIMGEQGQKDLEQKTSRIKDRVKHRSRGIDGGFGSFRNGTLHVGKEDFERVEKQGKRAGGSVVGVLGCGDI
ncbi:hypothetical protein HKX48_000727, partial [Thoreauomyces humboldtii]